MLDPGNAARGFGGSRERYCRSIFAREVAHCSSGYGLLQGRRLHLIGSPAVPESRLNCSREMANWLENAGCEPRMDYWIQILPK